MQFSIVLLSICVLGILIDSLQALSFRTVLSCEECLMISDSLRNTLRSLDETGERGRPRRRLIHGRSEPIIFQAIDTVCAQVFLPAALHPRFQGSEALCAILTQKYRDHLENHIFENGVETLRQTLCYDLSKLCRTYELHDSGEL